MHFEIIYLSDEQIIFVCLSYYCGLRSNQKHTDNLYAERVNPSKTIRVCFGLWVIQDSTLFF